MSATDLRLLKVYYIHVILFCYKCVLNIALGIHSNQLKNLCKQCTFSFYKIIGYPIYFKYFVLQNANYMKQCQWKKEASS